MNRQDQFLAVTVTVIVLGLAALTLTGTLQYTTDRNNHRNSTTITNDHVTNLPWSLTKEGQDHGRITD